MVAAVFLAAFIWIELTVKKPLVDLRLLKRRNFGIGMLANVLVGFALFGSVYILPQYLGQVQRYNAEQIGKVLAWTGLPQLLLIPLVPLLMKRFDVRYIGFVGISMFAASCFMNITHVARHCRRPVLRPEYRARHRPGPGADADDSRSRRSASHPSEARRNASGLFNMLRNLGGAVGTATLATILTKREQFHSNIIGQAVTSSREEVRQRIDRPDRLLHGARRVRSRRRAAPGDRRDRRDGQAPGAGDGLQRHLRGHRHLLAIAAVALLFARRVKTMSGAGGAH